jgi:hypothetical protein
MMTTLRISISIDMLDYEITNSVQWHFPEGAILLLSVVEPGFNRKDRKE